MHTLRGTRRTRKIEKIKNISFYLFLYFYFSLSICLSTFLPLWTDVDMDKDVVCCEVPYGGMLLINNMIPHRRSVWAVVYIFAAVCVWMCVCVFVCVFLCACV